MNVTSFEELTELLVTDQIEQKIPPEIRERFVKELHKLKEVNVLVKKLNDFDTAALRKPQNIVSREEKTIDSRVIC